jgi:hypothetical protein
MNATPVNAVVLPLGLLIVKVSELVAFRGIPDGVNNFEMDGGAITVRLAEAVPPVPPCVEVTWPVVLFCVPAVMPVTFTENVHELLGARLAPDKMILLVPTATVMGPPPQLPVKPFGVAITRPTGSVSAKPTPVKAAVVLLF